MSDPSPYTHCPSCRAEYRAGYTICTSCGSLLVAGPAPPAADEPRGDLAFRTAAPATPDVDRFSLEETAVVLTTMVEEDVSSFLAALDAEGIGARAGARTDDGGIEVVVHAANVVDAQAVLVEFTGDVDLVDDIGVVDDDGDGEPAMAVATTARLHDAGALAARVREHGIDVRIELPDASDARALGAHASILVRVEDLARARDVLGITP